MALTIHEVQTELSCPRKDRIPCFSRKILQSPPQTQVKHNSRNSTPRLNYIPQLPLHFNEVTAKSSTGRMQKTQLLGDWEPTNHKTKETLPSVRSRGRLLLMNTNIGLLGKREILFCCVCAKNYNSKSIWYSNLLTLIAIQDYSRVF